MSTKCQGENKWGKGQAEGKIIGAKYSCTNCINNYGQMFHTVENN
jgi:hypothetical protein